ncbi:hypothetical protein PV327_011596, partial [Microctonus hyperodae]
MPVRAIGPGPPGPPGTTTTTAVKVPVIVKEIRVQLEMETVSENYNNVTRSMGNVANNGAPQRNNMHRVDTASVDGGAPSSIVTPFIKIAQANLGRSKNATSEMYSLVQEQRLDVLLIQEPYARATGTSYIVGGLGISA